MPDQLCQSFALVVVAGNRSEKSWMFSPIAQAGTSCKMADLLQDNKTPYISIPEIVVETNSPIGILRECLNTSLVVRRPLVCNLPQVSEIFLQSVKKQWLDLILNDLG